jgi:hypothetical protein
MAVQQYQDQENIKYCRNCLQPSHEGYEITYVVRDLEGRPTGEVATCDDNDCRD